MRYPIALKVVLAGVVASGLTVAAKSADAQPVDNKLKSFEASGTNSLEATFRTFMAKKRLKETGTWRPSTSSYKVELKSDLNADGLIDFAIANFSQCGTLGCQYEIYTSSKGGTFKSIASDILGTLLQIEPKQSGSAWKSVIVQDAKDGPVFKQLDYVAKQGRYEFSRILSCQQSKFSECMRPVVFCFGASDRWDVKRNARYYSQPSLSSAGVKRDDLEPDRKIEGFLPDFSMFLVTFRQSPAAYVHRSSVSGLAPGATKPSPATKDGCNF